MVTKRVRECWDAGTVPDRSRSGSQIAFQACGCGWRGCVLLAPGLHGNQDWVERAALGREQIFGARRMVGIQAASENAVGGKLLYPTGEHAGGEAGETGFKVLEAAS